MLISAPVLDATGATSGARDAYASALIWTDDDRRCGLCGTNGQLGRVAHQFSQHLEVVLATGERYEIVTDRYVFLYPGARVDLSDPAWRRGMETMLAWLETEGYQVLAMRRTRHVAPCETISP